MTGSTFSQIDHDRALRYLASLDAKCSGCRHFVAAKLECDQTGETQSPHGLCLCHRPPKVERKVTA
jgi:hypothetical protein